MTLSDLITILESHNLFVLVGMLALPLLAYLYIVLTGSVKSLYSPHKYVYAVIVYLACVPGIFAAVLTAYTFFFLQENLLMVNAAVYFLPIFSMTGTLVLLSRKIDLDAVPGFDRLRGLMIILGLTFIISFLLIRLRVWLLFGGSMVALLILMLVIFLFLRYGSRLMFRNK